MLPHQNPAMFRIIFGPRNKNSSRNSSQNVNENEKCEKLLARMKKVELFERYPECKIYINEDKMEK